MSSPRPSYGERARIGVLLPSGNVVAEPELACLMPDGVSLHVTRLPLSGSSEQELLGMASAAEQGAHLLRDASPDLVAFHCTAVSSWSASMERSLCERVESTCGVRSITTAGAIVAALGTLDARRVTLLTPYIEPINLREVDYLRRQGIEVVNWRGLGLNTPGEMMGVDPDTWLELAREHDTPRAQAVVLSCTAIRTLGAIASIESAIGKPVVTSNQAMAWLALRRCAIADEIVGAGVLMSRGECAVGVAP